MDKAQALSLMKAPGDRRKAAAGAFRGLICQIHITRACDLACANCTQGSQLRGKAQFISLENVEKACQSLEGFWGVVAFFGGNCCLAPEFPEMCEILRKYFPREQCGVWTNHPRGHGKVLRETFNPGCSNLNVHLVREAYDEFKRDWPESRPFGLTEDSRHSPPYVAMIDLIEDESLRWELISKCPINQSWSPMLVEIKGNLYAYFCEIAGAQALLHANDPKWPITGMPAEPGWWRKPMQDFADQVEWHCHRCGVPLNGHGELATSRDGVEQVSATHADIYKPKVATRTVQVVDNLVQLDLGRVHDMTKYVANANR